MFAESQRAVATRARREAILAAALEVFLEYGVAAAPIDAIRRRSGASVGSIYHHFGSKEGVAAALYVDSLRDYQRGTIAALRAEASTRGGIETVVRHHLHWVATHPDMARYLLAERETSVVLASAAPLRDLNREFFDTILDWVRPRVARGELRRVRPDALLYALWLGPSQELARHWLAGRVPGELEASAPALAEAAWHSLGRDG